MKRLDVIPKPNKVEFLGGEVDPSELEISRTSPLRTRRMCSLS